jgi:hypothetical protein
MRRLFVIAAACSALLGLGASSLATPAKATVTQIPLTNTGLLRVCLIIHSADTGACLHI